MRHELSDGEFDALGSGQLVAPDHRTYVRRTTRMKRKDAAALVEAGSPVVTYFPGGGLIWHDGDDAGSAWADARPLFSTDTPGTTRREAVTAGRWESVDGSALVVLIRHH